MVAVNQREDWFDGLPATTQTQILKRMEPQHLKKGEYLYRTGDQASNLYLVKSGFIYLNATDADGNEVVITVYGPGSWIGEIPVIAGTDRGYDAQALVEAEVAMLSREDLKKLSTTYPEIHQQLTSNLLQVIKKLLIKIEETALLTLGQRLAKLLLFAAENYGSKRQEGVQINMPLTQANMGKMLGVTRQSILRELKHYQEDGIIDRIDGHWIVRDINSLKEKYSPHR